LARIEDGSFKLNKEIYEVIKLVNVLQKFGLKSKFLDAMVGFVAIHASEQLGFENLDECVQSANLALKMCQIKNESLQRVLSKKLH
jgi:hypothetical protein